MQPQAPPWVRSVPGLSGGSSRGHGGVGGSMWNTNTHACLGLWYPQLPKPLPPWWPRAAVSVQSWVRGQAQYWPQSNSLCLQRGPAGREVAGTWAPRAGSKWELSVDDGRAAAPAETSCRATSVMVGMAAARPGASGAEGRCGEPSLLRTALPPAPAYISALGESAGGLYLQNCGDTMETEAPNKTDAPSGVRILPKSGGLTANSLTASGGMTPTAHLITMETDGISHQGTARPHYSSSLS